MSRLSRRDLLAAAGAGGVAILAARPAAGASRPPALRGGAFSEGVMSGDPGPTAITLATRLAGVEGPGTVQLEIARDAGFQHVVTRSALTTTPALGHAIKARVTGLEPQRRYHYRFSGATAESPAGRFQTAPPPGSSEVVTFGIFTGQDFAAGYLNAQARLALEDLDFVLNLGGYVNAAPAVTDGVRTLSSPDGAGTLAAFRQRYRDYRADAGLRAMHAAHSLISTWDDGEVRAGYAGTDPAIGDVKAAAYRAWFESMPHYPRRPLTPRVFQRRSWDRNLDLFVLDTRQYRREPPSEDKTALLGQAQSRILRAGIKDSKAAWKLVVSPAAVAELRTAPDALDGVDSWQGYQAAREELLATIDAHVDDAVFVSGGRRRFVAAEVLDQHGKAIVPEFTCGSVSQRTEAEIAAAAGTPGYGTLDAVAQPDEEVQRLRAANPAYREDDQLHHGYAVCSLAPDLLTMRFEKLATVRQRSRAVVDRSVYQVDLGARAISDG